MKCFQCGQRFSPTDISEFDNQDPPLCDVCCLGDSYFSFEYNNKTLIIEAINLTEAITKWKEEEILSSSITELKIRQIGVFTH